MSHTDADARQGLVDDLAEATDDLGRALAALGAAYEQLDDQQADRLEEELFRPVQRAYGRAQRAQAEFATRFGLNVRRFEMPDPGVPSTGVKGFVDDALAALELAEARLVALQESPMAIQVGDVELRAGVSEVRRMIDGVAREGRALVSRFGR